MTISDRWPIIQQKNTHQANHEFLVSSTFDHIEPEVSAWPEREPALGNKLEVRTVHTDYIWVKIVMNSVKWRYSSSVQCRVLHEFSNCFIHCSYDHHQEMITKMFLKYWNITLSILSFIFICEEKEGSSKKKIGIFLSTFLTSQKESKFQYSPQS